MKPRIEIDYYAVLGVEETADRSGIQKAFRRQAKRYHPDLFPIGSPERARSEAYFKVLNEARDVLLDPQLRSVYDQQRPRPEVDGTPSPYPRVAPAPYPPPYGRRRRDVSRFNISLSFQDILQRADAEAAAAEEEEEPHFSVEEAEVPPEEEAERPEPELRKQDQADYYYERGWQYTRHGRFDLALECFRQAAFLDPSRKIPLWLHLYRRKSRSREEW